MAGIRKKGDAYYCTFRFQGERYNFAIGEVSEDTAKARGKEVDETLDLLERGRLTIAEGVSLTEFVKSGGKATPISPKPESLSARELFDRYLDTLGNGTVEETTLSTARTHLSQCTKTLNGQKKIQGLSTADLQGHIDRRRKKRVAAVTMKKELATLRACWNWAVNLGLVAGDFPSRGLRFPKEDEKEPFRSYAEIAGMPEERREDLWEALYLTRVEIEELLEHVRRNATLPWVYPMVAFAAYTGARRSELLRALAADVDLRGRTVTIREKKRVVGKRSTRTAPLTPKLAGILGDWLAVRPACSHLFSQATHVARSRTKREAATAVTPDEAHDHFKRTVAESKWEVLRGFHVLRHSFISALASEGVDQRVIDEIVGHQSEEQRKRYRHLYPAVMKEAIARVFG